MRQTLVAVAVACFSFVGCGSNSASTPPDMALAPLNCLGVGYCVFQCVSTQKGSFTTCANTCSASAKQGSGDKWKAAFSCGQDYCLGPQDMGGKCVILSDPSNPNNPDLLCDLGQSYKDCAAATGGACLDCIANARNIIYADFSMTPPNAPAPPTGMCPMPSSPDCKGGAMCTSLMDACIGDM